MDIYIFDRSDCVMKEIEAIVRSSLDCRVLCFADTVKLRQSVDDNPPDILFLDAEIRNAIPIAERLKLEHKKSLLILMADSDSYASEAFELGASGYIVKPITEEKIAKQVFQMRG